MNPCNLCPRQCNVDRSQAVGWCRMDDKIHVSSIVLHRGEEPPISGERGVVNVFFPSCNMQCIYCQNWEISCRGTQGRVMSLDEVCDAIISLLPQSENNLGFVSPSHSVLQMIMIVQELRKRGHFPTVIYNTNGYDLPETIRSLESIVDVWLPDFKYSDDDLSMALSEAPHYSHFALKALKEMVHQVGTTLHTDESGIARRGIIIRHLVLPGFVENSLRVLRLIADNLTPYLHISLMSQYYPPDNRAFGAHDREDWIKIHKSQFDDSGQTPRLSPVQETFLMDPGAEGNSTNPVPKNVPIESGASGRKSLDRPVSLKEYGIVVESFHFLGLARGWLQEYESPRNYRPDFSKEHPFE